MVYYIEMANWLDASSTSNLFRSIYIKGFVDISGGDFIARNGNLSIAGNSLLTKNVTVGGNINIQNNLYINRDVSVNGNLFAVTMGINENSQKVATTAYVQNNLANYVSVSGGLYVGDVSFNKSISIVKDISVNRNIYTGGNIYGQTIYQNGSTLASTYATLASPILTGIPTAPTAATGTNTNQVATTGYVVSEISSLIGASSSVLTTLQQLAGEIQTDSSYSSNILSQVSSKAPIDSPAFTGQVSGITQSMVGLSNVDNTHDIDKPISTATQTALNTKAPTANPVFTGTVSGITSAMVGLSNVNNTSDANKPISNSTQTALNAKAPVANPTFTGTVSGITKAMIDLSNVDNTSDLKKPISTATQAVLNLLAPINNPKFTGDVSGITKAMVGLSLVDNTSDLNKPISNATQEVLSTFAPMNNPVFTGDINVTTGNAYFNNSLAVFGDASFENNVVINNTLYVPNISLNGESIKNTYATKVSPVFTGIPTAPTASLGTSSGQLATTEYVINELSSIIGSAPNIGATLQQLSNIIQNDSSYASNIIGQINSKAPSDSATFTGITYFTGPADFQGGVIGITASTLGLGNVDNTSDADKPISDAVAAAIAGFAPIDNPTFSGTVNGITPTMIGLGSVNNTSDADKPISSAVAAVIAGLAPSHNPTFTGTVGGITATSLGLGNVNNTSDANKPISSATQTALNLKAPINNPTFTGTVGGITKSMIGLSNVDNTSDTNKPISNAVQTALDTKISNVGAVFYNGMSLSTGDAYFNNSITVNKNIVVGGLTVSGGYITVPNNSISQSSIFGGIVDTTSTQTGIAGDKSFLGNLRVDGTGLPTFTNMSQILLSNYAGNLVATTGYVRGVMSKLIGTAPETLNTVYELANALNGDASAVTNLYSAIGMKANTANPTFTGTVTIPTARLSSLILTGDASLNGNVTTTTQATSDNSIKLATTAYVKNQGYSTIIDVSNTYARLNNSNFTNGMVVTSGDISLNNNLFVGGDASINGTLNTKDISVTGNILPTVGNLYNLGSGDKPFNSLYINKGTLYFTETVMDGTTKPCGSLSFDPITGTIIVTSIQTSPDVPVPPPSTAVVSVNGNVGIGTSSPQHTLDVSGTSNLNGNVILNQVVYVTTDVSINSNMIVGGNTTLNGELYLNKDISLNGKMVSNGKITMNGGLTVASGIISLPTASISDSALSTNIARLDGSQTLINKTLTRPVITDISNNGTITIPTGTHILATLDGTETLTNKTVSAGIFSNTSLFTGDVSMGQSTYIGNMLTIENGMTLLNGSLTLPINSINPLSINNGVIDTTTTQTGIQGDKSFLGTLTMDGAALPSFTDISQVLLTNYAGNLVATTGYVRSVISNLIGSSPEALNTIYEIANALNTDAEAVDNLYTAIGAKSNSESPVFTGTASIPTASVTTLLVSGDSSLNGTVTVTGNLRVVTPLTSDNSTRAATTAYVQNQGYATLLTPSFIGNVAMNSRLFVSGDASFGGKIIANGDLSLNKNLNIDGNLTAVTQTTSDNSTKVATTAYVKNQGYSTVIDVSNTYATITSPVFYNTAMFNGDISLNTNLIVGQDISVNGNVFFNNNATITKNLYVLNDASFTSNLAVIGSLFAVTQSNADSSTKVATTAYVQNQAYATIASPSFTGKVTSTGDVSMNMRLFVNGDVSLNNRLYVSNNSYFTGNMVAASNFNVIGELTAVTQINTDNSTKVATTAYVQNQAYATIDSPSFTGKVTSTGDVSMNSRLFINGDVSLNSRLYVSSDVSINGSLTANYPIDSIPCSSVNDSVTRSTIQTISGSKTFTSTMYPTDISMGGTLFTNNISVTGNILPTTGRIYNIGSPELPFGSLYIHKGTIHFTDTDTTGSKNAASLSFNNTTGGLELAVAPTTTGGDPTVAIPIMSYNGNVSIGTNLSVGTDASFGGSLRINNGFTVTNGPIQLPTSSISDSALSSNITTLVGTQTLTNKTLTAPIISTISNTGTLTLPTITDTLVGLTTVDTLTNKTLTAPKISTISNTGTLTLPTSTDTLVGLATVDTLTNKTLTAPKISTISNTGTLTLPTSTDTLVGLATVDTLTNKTLTAPIISTISNSGTITVPTGTHTLSTLDGSETLTNKTLTTPTISSILNGGTLTLPSSTDTLVGLSTTDTLSNKTLTAPIITSISNNGTITIPTGTHTLATLAGTETLTNKTITTTGLLTAGAGLTVSSGSTIIGDLSANGNVFLGKDLTIDGNLYVKEYTNSVVVSFTNIFSLNEDISLNGNLFVSSDVSMSSRLFVSKDASFSGKMAIGGDVSLNGAVTSNGLMTMKNGMTVSSGTITLPNSSISDSALSANIVTLIGSQTLANKSLTFPVISTISNGGTVTLPTGTNTLASLDGAETFTNKTLTTPSISSIINSGTLTLPTVTDTLVGRTTTDTLTNKTLTTPIISSISNGGTITLPTTTDTLVGRTTSDTLTNKTLTSPIISSISNSGTITIPTGTYTLSTLDGTETLTNKTLNGPNITTIMNTGTLTLPTTSDTLVGRATTDTLTNKTLTNPNIATIVNTGTLTLPTTSDTLVGRTTTDTLTNKTLTSPVISSISNGGTVTIPTGTNTLSTLEGTETLTNKTLTSPTIATIINTGTLTLPTTSDTLVGRSTTDTLVNKTLTSPVISSISNGGTVTIPTGTNTLATLNGTETFTNKTITTSGLLTAGNGLVVSVSDVSINTRLLLGGDASMNGNLTVFGNLRAVTQSISDNSTLAATTAYVKAQGYSTLTSPSFTGTVVSAGDVSFNSRLFLQGDASFNGNVNVLGNLRTVTQLSTDNSTLVATTAFVKSQITSSTNTSTLSGTTTFTGDASMNSRLFVAGDVSLNSRLYVSGSVNITTPPVSDNSTLAATTGYVKSQGYATLTSPTFTGTVTSVGDASLNSNLYVARDASFNSKLTANTFIFGSTPVTKYYNWTGSPITSIITTPKVTLNFGNNSFYAKIHCFISDSGNENNMSTQVVEIQGGNINGSTPNNIMIISRITAATSYAWNYPTTDGNNIYLGLSSLTGATAYYSIRVELIQTNGSASKQPMLQNITMVNDNVGGTVITNYNY